MISKDNESPLMKMDRLLMLALQSLENRGDLEMLAISVKPKARADLEQLSGWVTAAGGKLDMRASRSGELRCQMPSNRVADFAECVDVVYLRLIRIHGMHNANNT